MQKRYGIVRSSAQHGIQGVMVDIEVAISPGLPGFELVGLADPAIKESRNRVQAAIRSSGCTFPNSRITASLAPAWLRKQGSAFDLPLALAILIASGQVPNPAELLTAFGELTLDGRIRGVPGAISRYAAIHESGSQLCMLPSGNRREVEAIADDKVVFVSSLAELVALLNGNHATRVYAKQPETNGCTKEQEPATDLNHAKAGADISSIVGQEHAIRAIEIAAAGQHNLLLLGSPGSGKTALVNTIMSLLPPLNSEESLELTRIYSVAGLLGENSGLITKRPFRAPHHSISKAAMLGGGSTPRPGEVSLAHHGVLFLDEMTEFEPAVLDNLRQPLEEKLIRVSRSQYTVLWPASFLLVGAANPCRCGNYLDDRKRCSCDDYQVKQHLSRLSGPLLDRVDLFATMTRLDAESLNRTVTKDKRPAHTSVELAARIAVCRQFQLERCCRQGLKPRLNGLHCSDTLADDFLIPPVVLRKAATAAESLQLTVRGYQKILRVARTIADLAGEEKIGMSHLGEALQFRMMIGDN
ncbi:MAG: YifB family Mg chelatase-like AAA ATPase [Saccharofermentanales bacterium]